ncbi:DUF2569 domain-containing protein [Altererythrobacter luteolus]|uniref:DUF2569 domain-containing protein n=1 Tax=Pontixanthobacter luteolus TaxID=295089 RepID=A0A6I4V691_9SPHN|nr:DUF2569 domain-containing protein [Pontixanthobacter luteolus]MXP48330.1 DUF2569 domain-containing protein [Pontixanthobacter luteolus]
MLSDLKIIGKQAERHVRAYADRWLLQSAAVPRLLEAHLSRIFTGWAALMALLCSFKVMTSPTPPDSIITLAQLVLPYALVAAAPLAGYFLARATFPKGAETQQPQSRLALLGTWKSLDLHGARRDRAYGPSGIVATILVGLLLNILIRTAEFSVAVPALNSQAPEWGQWLMLAMTADLVILNFFYMVCFAMALKGVPLFPRMLVFTWLLDLQMQLAIAKFVSLVPPPEMVASALVTLLGGNVQKVLLSMCIWLPILILSRRINVTYRHREPASA